MTQRCHPHQLLLLLLDVIIVITAFISHGGVIIIHPRAPPCGSFTITAYLNA
jgi:hypothetical protein